MKYFKFFFVGVFFGIVMFKSEAASWFRIYEMFMFQSFHMYGIIGSALALGISGIYLIKKYKLKTLDGKPVNFTSKKKGFSRYSIGGVLFGLGWALAGSCPGPIYTLIGAGYLSVLIVLLGALIGTLFYGLVKHKLPH